MKKVLVVDDDPSTLELISDIVLQMGLSLLRASSAEEAMQIFPDDHSIDCVVTDIRMGPMDGLELGRKLKQRQPGLRILFISGFISDASSFLEGSILPLDAYFLHKPFSPREISKVIRIMLTEREYTPQLTNKVGI